MALTNSFAKSTDVGGFAYGADQGMPHIVAAAAPGMALQMAEYSATGSPQTVTFAGLGMAPMADDTYLVFFGGAPTSALTVSARTVAGFTVSGASSLDNVHVLVVGRLAGQAG